jgi:hypothetical protein
MLLYLKKKTYVNRNKERERENKSKKLGFLLK